MEESKRSVEPIDRILDIASLPPTAESSAREVLPPIEQDPVLQNLQRLATLLRERRKSEQEASSAQRTTSREEKAPVEVTLKA